MVRLLRICRKIFKPQLFLFVSTACILMFVFLWIPGTVPRLTLNRVFRANLPACKSERSALNGEEDFINYAVCMKKNASVSKGEVEDLFCMSKPDYIPAMKNPCWWDNTNSTPTSEKPATTPSPNLKRSMKKKPTPPPTYGLKCLPYAHILCCSKSGTTDLFNRISQHPGIVKTGYMGKEHLYWSWTKYVDASPPDMWDLRGWPLLPQNEGEGEPKVLTPHLMKHLYRDPKFIVLMRDPIERIYTAYLFHSMGKNAETFHYDVIYSINVFSTCLSTMPNRRQCYLNSALIESLTVEIPFMCYAFYIKEWLAVFPKERFLFLQTERYAKDTKSSLLKVFKFLNMSTPTPSLLDKMSEAPNSYHTKEKEKAGPMRNSTRDLLRRFIAPCNEELADLLGDIDYLWNVRYKPIPPVNFEKLLQNLEKYRRGESIKDDAESVGGSSAVGRSHQILQHLRKRPPGLPRNLQDGPRQPSQNQPNGQNLPLQNQKNGTHLSEKGLSDLSQSQQNGPSALSQNHQNGPHPPHSDSGLSQLSQNQQNGQLQQNTEHTNQREGEQYSKAESETSPKHRMTGR